MAINYVLTLEAVSVTFSKDTKSDTAVSMELPFVEFAVKPVLILEALSVFRKGQTGEFSVDIMEIVTPAMFY